MAGDIAPITLVMARLYYLNRTEHRTPQYQGAMKAWENVDSVVAQIRAFVSGVLADNAVNTMEAHALHKLLADRAEAIDRIGFPLTDLARRVDEYARDGVWTPEELTELQAVLEAFASRPVDSPERAPIRSNESFFTDPASPIEYHANEFVLTGNFAFGTKNQVIKAIEERGGVVHARPRHGTRYVIVGSFVSEGWAHGNYGRKIEAAMDLRESGQNLDILSEDDWKKSL